MPQDVTPVITNPIVDLLPRVGMPSHQGTIRWDDAYSTCIDFEWKCTPTRLAKILEIDSLASLPTPQQYIIDGGNPVLRLNLIFDPSNDLDIFVDGELWDKKSKTQTFNIIEFRKNGEVLWGFMPLRYWGSNPGDMVSPEPEIFLDDDGEPYTVPSEPVDFNKGQSIATLEKRGNKLYISIRTPYSWLQTAIFPVFVDVDVDEQVGANADDCWVYKTYPGAAWAFQDGNSHTVGQKTVWGFTHSGTGQRFQTVALAQAETIDTASLIITASGTKSSTTVKSYIQGEDADDAAAFSTYANYNGRARTTAKIAWDGIAAWTDGVEYTSPEIKTVIQEIVDRGGWATGQDIVIFWEDHDNRSSASAIRGGHSHNLSNPEAPQLHVEYTAGGGFTAKAVGGGAVTMAGNLGLYTFIDVGEGAVTMGGVLGAVKGFVQALGGGAVTMAGVLTTVYKFSLAVGGGAVGLAGALGRAIAMAVGAGTLAPTGALALLTRIDVGAGVVGIAGILNRLIKIALGAGAVGMAGALGLLTRIGIGAGAVGMAGTLARLTRLAVGAGAVGIAGVVAKVFKLAVGSGAVGMAGTLGRTIKIAVGSGAVGMAGVLAAIKAGTILFITSQLATVLNITKFTATVLNVASQLTQLLFFTKSNATELIITSSISTLLTIKSSMAVR